MSNQDGLFWYPAINYKFTDKINKGELMQSYVKYFLARLQTMFKYEGLPDTIPAKYLEHYLLCNGQALIARADDGNLYAFFGGYGGDPSPYYIPTKYIVANPYLNLNKTFTINEDSVLIYGDTYAQGVLPMLNTYCTQLVENTITLNIADILARATLNFSAADDKTKASAELYLKRLRDGELGVIYEKAFIEGLNLREFSAAANSITNLIEYHQYIKASLFNELGLNSNYNMKRESINSNESQLNDDMLHPLIDDMLRERREGIDRVNDMFGLDIKVDFSSAWLENEIEEQTMIDNMSLEQNEDAIIEDDTKEYNIGDQVEEVPEEVPEEVTEDITEDELDAVVEEITQVIEAAADEIIDNIEGSEEDTENE